MLLGFDGDFCSNNNWWPENFVQQNRCDRLQKLKHRETFMILARNVQQSNRSALVRSYQNGMENGQKFGNAFSRMAEHP